MADNNRTYFYPDNRNRSRSHVPCPRCHVDPSHVSRQYWDATRPSVNSELLGGVSGQSSSPSTYPPVNGYPDLCPRSVAGNQRPHTAIPTASPSVPAINRGLSYYSSSHSSNFVRSNSDTHSTRSAGDTWRIRGVLENYQPDVTRRADSNTGPLPDVTRHSTATNTVSNVQHSRIPSTSGYDAHEQNASRIVPCTSARYTDSNHHSSIAPNYRDTHSITTAATTPQRAEIHSRAATPQWKREHQCSNSSGSPWVTRGPPQNPPHLYSNNNSNNSVNNNNAGSSQWSNQQSSSSSCWRPAPQHVLSQCPLPDLVTPRRQARKQCCGLLATHSVAVRWFIVVVASLGLLCSVVGTVVGVVRAAGKEHLSVALLLIGLGIVLVSMSGVAWRVTSRDAPSCRTMFGLLGRGARNEPHRRFVPRVPQYGRPHPFSAMLYPDIPLRPPPPSYQASMQEYRLRLLLMDRPPMTTPPVPPPQAPPPPPPPTYRGPVSVYPRFPINIGISDYSRPPSYRSRPSSAGQPSPVSHEDAEITNTAVPNAGIQHSSDTSVLTLLSSAPNSASLLRPAPSTANNSNNNNNNSHHVEIVAQV